MSRTCRRKRGLKPWWLNSTFTVWRGSKHTPLEGKQLERYKKILYTDGGFPFQYVPHPYLEKVVERSHRMKTKTELAKFKKNEDYEVLLASKPKLPWA